MPEMPEAVYCQPGLASWFVRQHPDGKTRTPYIRSDLHTQALARIEALEAENKRLRESLQEIAALRCDCRIAGHPKAHYSDCPRRLATKALSTPTQEEGT